MYTAPLKWHVLISRVRFVAGRLWICWVECVGRVSLLVPTYSINLKEQGDHLDMK